MKVSAYYNDIHIEDFNELEFDLISASISRCCIHHLDSKYLNLNKIEESEPTNVQITKYYFHFSNHLYTAFTSPRSVQNYSKQKFIDTIKKLDAEFFEEVGSEWMTALIEHLKETNSELRFTLEDFDDKISFSYSFSCHPSCIKYVLEHLPYVQASEYSIDSNQAETKKELQKKLETIYERIQQLD